MGVSHQRGVGAYEASRTHSFTADRLYKADGTKRGVIFCPGGGADDVWYRTVSALPANQALPNQIAAGTGGFPIVSFESEFTWGNSTSMTRMTDLRTYAQASLGFKSGKVHFLGVSMGGLIALNWAKANPTLVQSISLVIPAVDPQDIYTNNRGGYQSSISTAYGGAVPDASCPAKNASSFTSIPTKLWYSTDDPICIASAATTFATGAGATAVSLGAQGHGATNLDPADVVNFIAANN